MGDLMVELGGIRIYEDPTHNGWGLLRDGIGEGWWDSPDSRDEDDLIPGVDGAFEDPEDPLVEGRRVTLRFAHVASSPEWSVLNARRVLAGLVKMGDLGFRVYEAGSWLGLRRARVRGRVRVTEGRRHVALCEITVASKDPLKYGPTRRVVLDSTVQPEGGLAFPIVDGALSFGTSSSGVLFPGVFAIRNAGTGALFPERFTVTGPVDGFQIISESHVVEYSAAIDAGATLVLTPYAGGRATLDGADVSTNLLEADWAAVEPGQTRGYFFDPVDPGAGSQLLVDYPEGAWY